MAAKVNITTFRASSLTHLDAARIDLFDLVPWIAQLHDARGVVGALSGPADQQPVG